VKDASDMLQKYTKVSFGVKVLDFLVRNIEEAEKMGLMDAKTLAIVVFGAQLDTTDKHHVISFRRVSHWMPSLKGEAQYDVLPLQEGIVFAGRTK